MRHAPTALNAETDGPEKIRGWTDVGLGDEGRAIATKAAGALAAHRPDIIFTSDLPRAHETAQAVAKELGDPPVVPTPSLRTWNVGDLSGQTVKDAKPQLDELQNVKRSTPAPGGESYLDFYQRYGKVLKDLQALAKDRNVLAVVHGRQTYAAPHLLQGKPPKDVPVDGAPHPGDILAVSGKRLATVHESGGPARATA